MFTPAVAVLVAVTHAVAPPAASSSEPAAAAVTSSADPESAPPATTVAPPTVAGETSVTGADHGFTAKLGAFVHTDARTFLGDGAERYADQYFFRRVRSTLDGTLGRGFAFRLATEFTGGRVQVLDAYLELRHLAFAKLRIGKLKPPVGLERLQTANALTFVERALPSVLVPTRDLGLELAGEIGILTYEIGVFDGSADGTGSEGDTEDAKTVAARTFVRPFAAGPLAGLGFGGFVTYGIERGTAGAPELPSYRTDAQNAILDYAAGVDASGEPDPTKTAVAAGAHQRLGAQAYYYAGPLGLQAEYVQSRQRLRKDVAVAEPTHRGWHVSASFVVTGERASYEGVVPERPFEPEQGGLGAVELAVRYAELDLDDVVFGAGAFADAGVSASRARTYAGGASWALNRHVRLLVDYVHTRFEGGDTAAGGAVADRDPEQVVLTRVQTVL